MMTKTRYIVLTLAILISLHYILSFSHEGRATSLDSLRKSWGGIGSSPGPDDERTPKVYHEPPYKTAVPEKYYLTPDVNGTMPRHANATIVMLARNGDLNGVVRSLTQLEAKFNTRFGYPYVFLNEEPFSDDFKRNVLALTNNKVEFGLIPKEHWYQPEWIDEERARASRKKMEEEHVIYGGSVPYRNVPLQLRLLLPPPAPRQVSLLLACRTRRPLLLHPPVRPLPLHAGRGQEVRLPDLVARVSPIPSFICACRLHSPAPMPLLSPKLASFPLPPLHAPALPHLPLPVLPDVPVSHSCPSLPSPSSHINPLPRPSFPPLPPPSAFLSFLVLVSPIYRRASSPAAPVTKHSRDH